MFFPRRLILALLLVLPVFAPLTRAASAIDEKPTPLRAPLPDYPEELRSEGITGTVVIGVYIDDKGSVTNAEVVKSTDPRFEKSAVEIVKKKWRFNPAKKDGAPVACKVNVPIRFSLNSAE